MDPLHDLTQPAQPTFTHSVWPQNQISGFVPDKDYDLVQPRPAASKKGIQCGQCGMKFDYGVAYGYCCGAFNCPCRAG